MTDYPPVDPADLLSAATQAATAIEFGPDAMKAAFELAYPPRQAATDAEAIRAQQALLDGMLVALMMLGTYAALRTRTTPASFFADATRAATDKGAV